MVIVLIVSQTEIKKLDGIVEIQGHRGCRGLLPENTVPGFLKAIDIGVDTIEMDTVISKDNLVVMSHEPWLNGDYCTGPNGEKIGDEHDAIQNFAIYRMNYTQIARSNCGHANPKFQTQTPFPIAKPLLSDVINGVEAYILHNGKRNVQYNIETKSKPEFDGILHPPIREFCNLLYGVLKSTNIISRVTIQSFDVRSLKIFKELDPTIPLSLLVEHTDPTKSFDYLKKLSELGFLPDIYSPNYKLLTPSLVSYFKSRGVRVIPWTINTYDEMINAVNMGVDGIITDYPNRATSFMRYPNQ